MKAGRAASGEPLTVMLIAVSILGGIALAIACSYRPVALWWVMVACSAINVVRFGARGSRRRRADLTGTPPAPSRIGAVLTRALVRTVDVFSGAKSMSKASLDRQHTRFLVWFLEHNLLWTTTGFGVSLLLWHRFGPTTPALVAMAALMTCGIFAALGAAAGATAPTLGLCWRERCQTPDLFSPRRIIHDIGCVVVLKNRRDDAARRDWANGGRFHELFLTVDDLARAGVEPGLQAVLAADDAAALRALARKERVDRALALTPVFAAGLLAALFVVPLLKGAEPLPSLWTIVSMSANSRAGSSADRGDTARDLPSGSATSIDERQARNTATDPSRSQPSSRTDGDPTSSTRRDRPDITGQGGDSSITGDAVASPRGDGDQTPGQGSGTPAGGETTGGDSREGNGSGGSGGSSSDDGRSGGSGGRGGGPNAYGTRGVAPQRAESPNALPDAPVNPGKAIEVVLPAFAQAKDDGPGDDPMGTKRKATATEQARAQPARHETGTAANEPATREPLQRWPNWVFVVLRK